MFFPDSKTLAHHLVPKYIFMLYDKASDNFEFKLFYDIIDARQLLQKRFNHYVVDLPEEELDMAIDDGGIYAGMDGFYISYDYSIYDEDITCIIKEIGKDDVV